MTITTTLTGVSSGYEKSIVSIGGRLFIRFGGIFSDSGKIWASYSPAGGLETKKQAVALMANDAELVRRYI